MLSLLLTPLASKLGLQMGLADQPGGRRKHQGVIPRTGGLALFSAFFIVILLTLLPLLLPQTAGWFPPRNDPNELRRLLALLGGTLFCVIAGYLDDRYEWSSWPQFAVQIMAGLIAISGLIFLKHINNPFGDGYLGGPNGLPWWIVGPVTIGWFMVMMNTVNWLDGLSGLVAGVTAIFCVILAVHMLFRAEEPQLSVAILPIVLLGAVLGFLPFNFAPARIFMGSSGSYFLGFALASLGIIGGARVAAVMLILGLPLVDFAWLIFLRWRRHGAPGQGGRDHLHFRLLDRGLAERTIVIGYWLFCALFGGLTLLIDDRLYKLLALLVLGLLALLVLVWAAQENETVE
ncbi:MAG: undecaprenyl/decaprenyl-phosphate alpha-N-acetylglucosaminyl 1-phosphate transferase [Caldilineaceae bacterium]|nr:undecaprenyl/decaprenyl-phosphate alpha-N-acetylglucosaminyl 1-phosphate transferase [Caldilineaceae bacterium]